MVKVEDACAELNCVFIVLMRWEPTEVAGGVLVWIGPFKKCNWDSKLPGAGPPVFGNSRSRQQSDISLRVVQCQGLHEYGVRLYMKFNLVQSFRIKGVDHGLDPVRARSSRFPK